jgi:acetate kinase
LLPRLQTILVVNAGSSSVRLSLVEVDGDAVHTVDSRREEGPPSDRAATIRRFCSGRSPASVAHRIVHGGSRFIRPVLLDTDVAQALEELAPLAPLHIPVALAWSRTTREVLGAAIPQVCVFDTTFFANLPEAAATYAIPRALAGRHGIRRFGFHGFAHRGLWRRWTEVCPDLPAGGRLITLQLGSGCSAAAIERGLPVDTSMGFTPMEGLVMSTRSGDVDPGVLIALMRREGFGPDDLERVLDRESGLLGISGSSADMRELLARPQDRAAQLAIDVFCRRVKKIIGGYLAILGGADGIVFGGGIGESSPEVRARCLSGLDALGIVLDDDANRRTSGRDGRISAPRSAVRVDVIVADEAAEIARDAMSAASRTISQQDEGD